MAPTLQERKKKILGNLSFLCLSTLQLPQAFDEVRISRRSDYVWALRVSLNRNTLQHKLISIEVSPSHNIIINIRRDFRIYDDAKKKEEESVRDVQYGCI